MLRRSAIFDTDPMANLQLALAIELAVLPPYLYACWSIKPPSLGAGDAAVEASRTIRSVLYQEMLHIAAVVNILHALGARPDFIGQPMKYPGYLPGHVTTGKYAFKVSLCRLSSATIKMFQRIELPEWDAPDPAPGDDWITIAGFYEIIKAQLKRLPDSAFQHGRQLPIHDNPAPGYLQPVTNLKSALLAIDAVILQGEGHRPKNPGQPPTAPEMDDDAREVAHYYKFATIGGYFEPTPPAPPLIDPDRDLYAVIDNPGVAHRFSDPQAQANLHFNRLYSQLLDALQVTVGGAEPEVFGIATRLMGRLEQAVAMLRNAGFVPGTQFFAGPTFEYIDVTAGTPAARPASARV